MILQFHSSVYIWRKKITLSLKDTCTPIITAALFTIAKIWKQPKHPTTDVCIKKMWSEVKWKSLNRVWLFVTPWTVESVEFSRPEYWSGLPFPFCRGSSQPRDWTQVSHIARRFFTSWATREAHKKDVVYIYNRILLSHKKEWNSAICNNMYGPRGYKWSKSEKDKYCMISLICWI